MATHMSATFTASSRRKRIATYGKSSRTLTAPAWNDDAQSPERPRKQAGAIPAISQRAAGTGKDTKGSGRKSSRAARDIFDVPSEDELGAAAVSPPPVKKPARTHSTPIDVFNVPSSDDDEVMPQRRRGKTPQLRKPASTRKPDLKVPSSRGDGAVDVASSDDPIAPARRRAKTPQVLQGLGKYGGRTQEKKKSEPSRTTSGATTPTTRTRATVKKTKALPKLSSIKSRKPPPGLDIFDVPSSGDDAPLLTPRGHKPVPIPRGRPPAATEGFRAQVSPTSNDSDDSNTSKKRKRSEQNREPTVNQESAMNKSDLESSSAPRSRKIQRKGAILAISDKPDVPIGNEKNDPAVSKPRRTRLRTAPGPPRAPLVKNQSAPAHLLDMLPVRSLRRFSPTVEIPQVEEIEEVTMYDIPYSTPKPARSMASGAVTPQQKVLFSNLLGDSFDATSLEMPSIRKLQLTDRKPGLVRSSSDIPQSTHTRKMRLIDALVQKAASEDEDSESDEETEEDIIEIPTESKCIPNHLDDSSPTDTKYVASDEMDIDSGEPAQSQGSQSALHTNIGSKVTYAKQRSYREDSNMEEGLLLGMDLDDPLGLEGFASKPRQDGLSEDEDDPASQVRGIHELRKQAQNEKFQMEAQTWIDDIADKAGLGKSLRRTAMMELCTRMGDRKFLEPLLDSSLVGQFLANIGYTSEIIFDFAACVSIAFILEARQDSTIVDEIYGSGIMTSLEKLLEYDVDINRIARERKTNMSKVGRDSVESFRNLVQMSSIWSPEKPVKVTPQIVALKTLESLVLALRKTGNTGALVSEDVVGKLLDIVAQPCERLRVGKETPQDLMMLTFAFSIMEASSISREKPATWSNGTLQRLADTISIFFAAKGASPIKLATRLCVLLTNNKPKACKLFASPSFVEPLTGFINGMFKRLRSGVAEEETEAREDLILSLGAMINIAEFSDKARLSMIANGYDPIGALVKTFLEGTERASQADSMEESQANIPIGYLTVLLGNLCLNDMVRSKIRSQLPGGRMDLLVEKVKEFVSFHERVDRMTEQFAGEEGRQVSQNYTRRLMQVVRRLEQAGA